jgi:hypothetical protein
MPEPSSTFVDRFTVFYDSCSPEEREVLAMLGTAAVLVRDGNVDESDVVGFQVGAGMSVQTQIQQNVLMSQLLTNLANVRHESVKTIANNLRG